MGNLTNKLCGLAALFFLFTTSVFAQGALSGTIKDKASGETIIGAYVIVQGTSTGTTTDFDGKYSLRLDPGTYIIEYTNIGYPNVVRENIIITDGEVTYEDVIMSDEEGVALDLNVTVKAERLTNTEVAVLVERKESVVISDNVSVQEMARYGATDASGALKKVTGASVANGKYVLIRGLGDRYSLTQLNGLIVPSTDPYRNSAQLDLIPTNLIDNISTSKTFTPDQPGNFTGGNIDIRTKKFPDLPTFSVSLSTGYNSQSNLIDNFLTSEGDSGDYFGYDNSRSIPESLTDNNIRQFLNRNGEREARRGNEEAAQAIDQTIKGISPQYSPTFGQSNLDHGVSVSYGNKYEMGLNTLGVTATASFKQDYQHLQNYQEANFEVQDFEDERLFQTLNLNTNRSTLNPTTSGLLGLAYRIGANNEINFTGMYNHTTEKVGRTVQGDRPDNLIAPRLLQGSQISFVEQELQNFQLGGEHSFPGVNNLKVEWRASMVNSSQVEPHTRFFENIFNSETGNYGFGGADINSPILFWRNLEDEQMTGKVDISMPFGKKSGNSIKVGGYYSTKDRVSTQDQFQLESTRRATPLNEFNGDINLFTRYENSGILSQEDDGDYNIGHYLSDQTRFEDSYTGKETVSAGYGMVIYQLRDNLKFVGGARVETTDMETVSRDTTRKNGLIDELDVLPSASIIYEVIEDFNIRGTFSRTLARPNMREISSFAIFDPLTATFERGNPDSLGRSLVSNFDLRFEYFLGGNELIALSGYYKDFTDPIIRQRLASSNQEFQYDNTPSGNLFGIELEIRKNLAFISPMLERFSLSSNATYIKSKVETQATSAFASEEAPFLNQPDYILNGALNYLNPEAGWDVALSLNSVGDQLLALATVSALDQYLQSRTQLDFVASKKFGNIRLRASVLNILDDPFIIESTYKGTDYQYRSFKRGIDFRFGVTFDFK